jgi:hypothetical protein
MTIYSKEKKTTRRYNEKNREDCILLGGASTGEYEKEKQEIGKIKWGMGIENLKTRWKMQWGRD